MATSSKNKKLAVKNIKRILLIGCGGTGSILAEHLARMIAGFDLLVGLSVMDGDTVQESNVWRQNFAAHEVGCNKAAALAIRLSGRFGIPVESWPVFADTTILEEMKTESTLFVTATDDNHSRKLLAKLNQRIAYHLWLDVGNEKNFGQAVIGTSHAAADLRRVYWGWGKYKGYVSALPDIAGINPAVMRARKRTRRAGCGQMPFADQGFGINAMAALAASVLAKQAVADGVVTTAGIYFDTASGRMTPRLIDKLLFRPWMRKER